jgi:hypothetical protein
MPQLMEYSKVSAFQYSAELLCHSPDKWAFACKSHPRILPKVGGMLQTSTSGWEGQVGKGLRIYCAWRWPGILLLPLYSHITSRIHSYIQETMFFEAVILSWSGKCLLMEICS